MKNLLLILTLFSGCSLSAFADVGDFWGFGSRSAGLSGANLADSSDGYAAAVNPAALSNDRLRLDFGMLWMHPQFRPIRDVVVQNNFNSDLSSSRSDDVDTQYKDILGQVVGLSLPIKSYFSLGAVFYFPLQQAAYLDTGETFIPEYALYRARFQKPQVEFGSAFHLSPRLQLGFGLHQAYSMDANADAYLDTAGNKASHSRIIASLKTKYTPLFGLQWKVSEKLKLGAVYRFASDYPIRTQVDAAGEFIFGTAPNVAFAAQSSLYYDPASFELGLTWQQSSRWTLHFLADYQDWSKLEVPFFEISDAGGTFTISPSQNPQFDFRDVWVLRLAEEFRWSDQVVLRLGYAWRQSIMASPPNGAGNLLDPEKHMLSLGLGKELNSLFGMQQAARLDFHFSYQHLVLQNIVKTPNNELGASGEKIGSPGYTAGGEVFGGGLSLSLLL